MIGDFFCLISILILFLLRGCLNSSYIICKQLTVRLFYRDVSCIFVINNHKDNSIEQDDSKLFADKLKQPLRKICMLSRIDLLLSRFDLEGYIFQNSFAGQLLNTDN